MIHCKEVNQNFRGQVSYFCLSKGGTSGLASNWTFLQLSQAFTSLVRHRKEACALVKNAWQVSSTN